ncbi:MAG: nucleotidyltransferase domain-containing protein [Moorellaceae bacterium]
MVEKRLNERYSLLEHAKQYVINLHQILPLTEAYVIGSVARGDYNVHSDIDVVIISDYLPSDPLERSEFLYRFVTPCIEPKGFTVAEWQILSQRKNPLALEVLDKSRSFKIFP